MKADKDTNSATPKVLVLGSDTPIGLNIIRDLGRHKCRVYAIGRDENSIGASSKYCSAHFVRPSKPLELISLIKEIVKNYNVDSLIAISEGDLIFLNQHRAELEGIVTMLVPEQEKLDIVLNKDLCNEYAVKVGISIPRSVALGSLDELDSVCNEINFPVVIKWADPNAVVNELEECGIELEKVEYASSESELRKILNKYSKLSVLPMIQEYAGGEGFAQMFLVKEGQALLTFQHKRVAEWPPSGGVSAVCESVDLNEHREAQSLSKKLLKELNWTGVAMVEYRFDPQTGVYKFMEVNGRFWGGLPLAINAGVSFPALYVHHLAKPFLTEQQLSNEYNPGLKACYFIPYFKRLLLLLFKPSSIQGFVKFSVMRESLAFLAFPFNRNKSFYVYNKKDPGPFYRDIKNIFKKILKR